MNELLTALIVMTALNFLATATIAFTRIMDWIFEYNELKEEKKRNEKNK